ncbi:MAG: DUF1667 domain-containing protein [Spirochaetales bacterium]|uniref:DUF1667 domain-containing protein n=1 Tax=Candidatus Thalassospirochaeta sargassi TaxID=3119039 RepID=A0AAJ1IHL5_9SPIO|nr:DUF1667 domain-containing protein [Spirochaetales bacterium]
MNRKLTCIECPRGCLLMVEKTEGVDREGGELRVSGNACPKGIDYGRQEVLRPMRMLTSTVRTDDCEFPRLPVRLSAEIPKERIFDCMKEINRITVVGRKKPGDVLVQNIGGLGVDLIASGGLRNER